MTELLAGLPKEVKYIDNEYDFIKPIKIKFRIKHGKHIKGYEAKLEKIQIVAYREADYGDDKIMPTKSRVEYVFKTNKLMGKVIK